MNDNEKSIHDDGECHSRRVTLKRWKSMANKNKGYVTNVTKPRCSVENVSDTVSKNSTEEKPAKPKSPNLSRIQELSKPLKSSLLHTWKTYSNVFDYDRTKKLMNKLNMEFSLTQEEKTSCMEHLRKNVISYCGKLAMGTREMGKKYRLKNDDIQRITGVNKSQKGARWSRRTEELARPKPYKVLATWNDYCDVLPMDKRVNFHRKYVESVARVKRSQEEQECRNSQRDQGYFETTRSSSSMMEERDRMMARAAAYKLVEKGVERALMYAEEGRPPPLMTRTLLKLSDNILAVLSDRNLIKMPMRGSQEKNAKFLMYVSDWTAKIISDAYLATEKSEAGQKVFTKKYIKSTSDKGIQETILEQDEDSPHEYCKEENSKGTMKKSAEILQKLFEDISEIDNSFGNESDWDEETGTLKDETNQEIKKLSITKSNTKIIHIRNKDNDQNGGEIKKDNNEICKMDTDKVKESGSNNKEEEVERNQKIDVDKKLITSSSKPENEEVCKIISKSVKSEEVMNDEKIAKDDEKLEENVQSSQIGDINNQENVDSANINDDMNVNYMNVDNMDVDNKNVGNKNVDNKNVDNKNVDNKNVDNKNVDNKNVDNKNVDNTNFDHKNVDNKNVDNTNFGEEIQSPQMDGDKNDGEKSLCSKINRDEIHSENIPSSKVENEEVISKSCQMKIIDITKIDSQEPIEDYSDTCNKAEDEDNLQDDYLPCTILKYILTNVNMDGKDCNLNI